MLEFDLQAWILSVIASGGLIAGAGFLMRDTVAKFFAKSIEHRFEKRLESFKSGIRDNEAELAHIRSFLASSHRDRESMSHAKRVEAAETLMRARHRYSQLNMLVEYMKLLKIEQILKKQNDPKIAEFIGSLIAPFDTDEKMKALGEIDLTGPRLYLNERSLKSFEVYQQIVSSAVMTLKFLAIPIDGKEGILKAGALSKAVIDLAPNSKEGFEKFGEGYAYYWATYFHDEIVKSLRDEISGSSNDVKDTDSVQKVAMASRRAQLNVRSLLEQAGLPESLIEIRE